VLTRATSLGHCGSFRQHNSQAFSSVGPAGTWAWRLGEAVRQGAVALALPREEVAVQLRAVAEALHAEATEVEPPRRAVVELALRAEAAMVE
jgi:hypothetical protein